MTQKAEPICRFYRLIPGAPEPQRADRSADGTLPMLAYRYCEAITTASAFGWYLFPPINFSVIFNGTDIIWNYEGDDGWYPIRAAQFPGFIDIFKEIAPEGFDGLAPTFLQQGWLPGTIQIWSGYLARTSSRWALLSRGTANIPRTQGYENFEGIVETDTWFGPLFTNLRLTATNTPIEFNTRQPLFQVQPVLRDCYQEPSFQILPPGDLDTCDWERFAVSMKPNTDHSRKRGHYAVDTRKRLRGDQ